MSTNEPTNSTPPRDGQWDNHPFAPGPPPASAPALRTPAAPTETPAATPELAAGTPAPPLPPTSAEDAAAAGEPAPARKPRKTKAFVLIGAGVVVVAAIVAAAVFFFTRPNGLETAMDTCQGLKVIDAIDDPESAIYISGMDRDTTTALLKDHAADRLRLVDDSKTLIVTTEGEDADPLGVSTFWLGCALEQLDAPARVTEAVNSTRALDGVQDAEWDGYEAEWRYHPDDGVNLIISID